MKLICLANSYKEGGRCIAGIKLDENNIPIIVDSNPVWIRPICSNEHGQIPEYLCKNLNVLDVIEIKNTNTNGNGYQSENTTFNESEINHIGTYDKSILKNLCQNNNSDIIFGNRGKAVPESTISRLNNSLLLLKLDTFKVVEKIYEGREYPQIRLEFNYNGQNYDLPITDPVFQSNYNQNNNLLIHTSNIFVVLSLGVPYNEWYYKLVAAIIY